MANFLDLDAYLEESSAIKLGGKEYKIKDFSSELMFQYQAIVGKYFQNAKKIKELMKKDDPNAQKQFTENLGLLHDFIFAVLSKDNEVDRPTIDKLGVNSCLGIIQFLTLVVNDTNFLERAKKLGVLKTDGNVETNPVVPSESESK